jgi:hypothetical protein
MELISLQCKTPGYADINRDGGSYSFGYKAKNGKHYELFLQVVLDSPADCKRYYGPLVFLGDSNTGKVVCHPTWDEVKVFLEGIKYKDTRFEELKWIVSNGGWFVPKKP